MYSPKYMVVALASLSAIVSAAAVPIAERDANLQARYDEVSCNVCLLGCAMLSVEGSQERFEYVFFSFSSIPSLVQSEPMANFNELCISCGKFQQHFTDFIRRRFFLDIHLLT